MVGRGRVNIFGNIVRGHWKFGINPFGGNPLESEALKNQNVLKCLLRGNNYELVDGIPINPAVYKNNLIIDDKNDFTPGISDVKSFRRHPARPLDADCNDRKLFFSDSAPQKITVSGTNGFKGKFGVVTVNDAPYTITPDSGSDTDKENAVLTVTPQFEKIKHPQVSKSLFFIRFEDGLSIPVHVSCDATKRPNEIKELRKNDTACLISGSGEKSELKFELKQDGLYYLFCKITPDTATTVKVSVDGSAAKDCSFFIPSQAKNPWCHLSGRVWRGGITYHLKLSAGTHTVTISGKAKITSAILTTNPDAY